MNVTGTLNHLYKNSPLSYNTKDYNITTKLTNAV